MVGKYNHTIQGKKVSGTKVKYHTNGREIQEQK